MLDITGTDIEINKGNSAIFTITLTGDDVPEDGTQVQFVVKKSPHHVASVLTKTLSPNAGVLTVQLEPEDTKELPVNTYFWNLVIQYDAGEAPWTISKRALKFSVLPEIGVGGS